MSEPIPKAVRRVQSAPMWLTPRRLRAHAIVLAVCLWGVFAVDFSTPGPLDRAGNFKFQDFLPFYVAAQMMSSGHAADLYNPDSQHLAMQAVAGQPVRASLPYLYGPQVAWMLMPFASLSFWSAALVWVAISLFLLAACVYLVWKTCPHLDTFPGLVALIAIAYPPLAHFVVRGQNSAVVLACFTVAFLAFRADRNLLAGLALGCLIFKPQFLVAIPLIFLFSLSWHALAGLFVSAGFQLMFTRFYFGSAVWHAYVDTLVHSSRWLSAAEVSVAPLQMHSLRAFWMLLVPSPGIAFTLYALTAIVTIAIATVIWKSSASLAIRFSALTTAAVLVNPHLFIYDLLVLVPVLLVLAGWAMAQIDHRSTGSIQLLLYLAVLLPLFGPLAKWIHVQLSVIVFALLMLSLRKATKPDEDTEMSGIS